MKSSLLWLGVTFVGTGISLFGYGRTLKAAVKEQEHAQRMATIRAFNAAVAESQKTA